MTAKKNGKNAYGQKYGEVCDPADLHDEQWAAAIFFYRKNHRSWDENVYGPKPMTPGCLAPMYLQAGSHEAIEELFKKYKANVD